jgi:hypothetical protein
MKQAEESELRMTQMRAQDTLIEELVTEFEATKRAAAEKELQWQTTLATLTVKLDAKKNLPEISDKEDNKDPHQGDSLRSLATILAAGQRELMKETAELKKKVAVDSSIRRSKPLNHVSQDQANEVKQPPASSTSEMAEKLTKPKASTRHKRKVTEPRGVTVTAPTATRDDRRKAARAVAACGAHNGTCVETPAVTMTTIPTRAKNCQQKRRWKCTRQRFRMWL